MCLQHSLRRQGVMKVGVRGTDVQQHILHQFGRTQFPVFSSVGHLQRYRHVFQGVALPHGIPPADEIHDNRRMVRLAGHRSASGLSSA
jgi:hypothetical protein